jgi:peptidoglycan/LPS O-acetylase OafA/YrhL
MRLTLAATLIVGAALLWLSSRREKARVPPWVPTLALASGSLGVSVAVATRPGIGWSISSICFSLIAIVLILLVIRDILRRPR